MRVLAAFAAALLITLTTFVFMQQLISGGQPPNLPVQPGDWLRLIRVLPEDRDSGQAAAPERLPEPPPSTEAPPDIPSAARATSAPALAQPIWEAGSALSAPGPLPAPLALPDDALALLDRPERDSVARVAPDATTATLPPEDSTVGATPPPAPPATGGLDRGRGSNGVPDQALMPLLRIEPVYPRKAARTGTEGWVRVEFTITEEGLVVNPVVLEAEPRGVFNRAALASIRKWRFRPRMIRGRPVETRASQVIEFSLAGR
jgi:protein TonB